LKFLRVISNLLRFDRTNWKAFALCLFAAAVFWIFNALNKNYSTNLALPLQLEFDEEKFAAAETIPTQLTVNVNGIGWELLRKSLGQKVPVITLPLDRPADVHRIVGAALVPQVVSQLGALQLNYVVLDTLRLAIEPKVSRKLKLTATLGGLTFKKDLGRISPVVVLPDSIVLEGPKSYIDALGESLSLNVIGKRIGGHYRESLEVLIEHSEFISRNPPVAEVMFEVGPITTVSSKMVLTTHRNTDLIADEDSITCSMIIPQKNAEQFVRDKSMMTASLPQVTLVQGDSALVLPVIKEIPTYVNGIHTDSILVRKKPRK
jgi:hypothetical protein